MLMVDSYLTVMYTSSLQEQRLDPRWVKYSTSCTYYLRSFPIEQYENTVPTLGTDRRRTPSLGRSEHLRLLVSAMDCGRHQWVSSCFSFPTLWEEDTANNPNPSVLNTLSLFVRTPFSISTVVCREGGF